MIPGNYGVFIGQQVTNGMAHVGGVSTTDTNLVDNSEINTDWSTGHKWHGSN